jgi:hypothetical protein
MFREVPHGHAISASAAAHHWIFRLTIRLSLDLFSYIFHVVAVFANSIQSFGLFNTIKHALPEPRKVAGLSKKPG